MDILSKIKRLRRKLCCCRKANCVSEISQIFDGLVVPVESDVISPNCQLSTAIFIGGIQVGNTIFSGIGGLMSDYISQLTTAFVGLATFSFDEITQKITITFATCGNYTAETQATCSR